MEQLKQKKLSQQIKGYIYGIDDKIFPSKLKYKTSIFLSGSTGWGIKEGFDQKADWDLHLILSDEDFATFAKMYGEDHVIDDNNHQPNVFGQIRSKKWLENRLSRIEQGDCVYIWIYSNCVNIQDPLNIQSIIDKYTDLFKNNQEELAKFHFVTYSVRRIDTVSAAKREIELGTRISNTEMVKAAMQTMSIIQGVPYSYNKWLGKQVGMLGSEGKECVELGENCLKSLSLNDIVQNSKPLKNLLKNELIQKFGNLPWIEEWWKYNQNPPEINLEYSKEN